MGDRSEIEWTDATWNPLAGCRAVSPGCSNCYAARMAGRLAAMGVPKYAGTTRKSGKKSVWTGKITLDYEALSIPLRWRDPRRIFVNSMSDLFQEGVPYSFVARVWNTMERAYWHTFQVLTKRPERMSEFFASGRFNPLPNVWVGTSVESSDYVARIDFLRTAPAAIRFLSLEPLLGPLQRLDLTGIDWVIVGGESGPRARPIKPEWVYEIRDQCEQNGVAFFFKQWGGARRKGSGRVLDGRTWDDYPDVAAE